MTNNIYILIIPLQSQSRYEQILPGRDRAGRRISVHIAFNSKNPLTAESRLRIFYYMQMSLTDDIETQRKGYVLSVGKYFLLY